MRKVSGLPTGGAVFTRATIGPCGGMVTGISQSTNGDTLMARCDVFGGALRASSSTTWKQAVDSSSIPGANLNADLSYTNADRPGVAEMVCAPSNGQYAMMQWLGWTFKSTNGGNSWTQTTIARQTMNCNGPVSRTFGRGMAFDPTNPDNAIVGTQSADLYYTTNFTNASPTWTKLTLFAGSTEPNGLNPVQHLVAFNPATPAEVWICIWGKGFYKSTTGVGGTFNLQGSTSTYQPVRFKFHDNGTAFFTQYGAADNLYKLANGAATPFTNITLGGKQIADIALDWSNASHLVGAVYDGTIIESTNGGTTWPHLWDGAVSNVPPQQLVRASIGKALDAGVSRQWSMLINNIEFDRAVAGQLIAATGVGFMKTTLPVWVSATATPIVWVEDNKGDIPMLVTQCGIFAGNGVFTAGCHDEGMWYQGDLTRYQNVRDQPASSRDQAHLLPPVIVQPCTDLKTASDDRSWVYGFQQGGTWSDIGGLHGPIDSPHWGWNDNYGQPGSWHTYTNQPTRKPFTMGGGFMIVGPKGKVIHCYNATGTPEYTEDNGATAWSALPIPGLAAQIAGGGLNGIEFQGNAGYWLNKKQGEYDAAAGKYRLFLWGSILGFYEASQPSGPWTRVSTDAPYPSALSAGYVWHVQFAHVPGVANKGYFSNGLGFDDPFMVTTDGCRNWSQVRSGTITQVSTFDFSAPATPGGPPCMMFWGKVSGVPGFYRTDDDFATVPKLLATYPMNCVDSPLRIVGNPNTYHDFRICYSGSGVIKVAYDDTLSLAA